MITKILAVIGAIDVAIVVLTASLALTGTILTRRAERKQGEFDQHVDLALALANGVSDDTPLYDRIAHEFAKDLDAEWAALNTGSDQ